ncbi:Glyoxalase-like domain protein [Streptomyces sp. S4.7]|uniref:VOC family protein n=1 Tax=Streptomyces sp. S4.7 TaxID=2705439 RepID=UPI001398BDE4|nr:VOC family protein [Streptomyces sp. S4.7]QHY97165.1 Glyoxalase-like domain protein [Streptomyces sp. S4.7]
MDGTNSQVVLQITIDCADPQRLVPFWIEALGYVPEPPPGGHATWREYWSDMGLPEEEQPEGAGEIPESIVPPDGVGPRVWFQQVPEDKVVKNRVHLDLKVGGGREVPLAVRKERITAKADRLTAAGATVSRVMDEPGMDYFGIVLQDPEGNEFCVG